jgi:hypothetical protein
MLSSAYAVVECARECHCVCVVQAAWRRRVKDAHIAHIARANQHKHKHTTHLLDLGDTSAAADEHHVLDLRLVELGVTEGLLDGVERAAEEVGAHLLEARAGD